MRSNLKERLDASNALYSAEHRQRTGRLKFATETGLAKQSCQGSSKRINPEVTTHRYVASRQGTSGEPIITLTDRAEHKIACTCQRTPTPPLYIIDFGKIYSRQ